MRAPPCGRDGGNSYTFGSIAGASRMTDGRIVVADAQARALKVFDSRGRLVRSIGREGSGPGALLAGAGSG